MNVQAGAIWAIALTNLRRLAAERSSYFFVIALPLILVFALGVAIGGSTEYRVGVVDTDPSASSQQVTDRIQALDNVVLVEVGDAASLRDDVARRTFDVGWVVEHDGEQTTYVWYSPGAGEGFELRTVLNAAVQEAGVHDQVVTAVADATGADLAAAEQAVDDASSAVPATEVTVTDLGEDDLAASIRAVLAAGELSLFIFLTSLTGAAFLLSTRQLGVTRRMRAAPISISAIVAGEALGRFLVAMVQAAIVFFGSMLLFGVDWRAPAAVALLCVAMSLVGTGAAMLLGTVGRSEQQVAALGLLLGLVLAALGGSMQPLEFFPSTMRTLAFLTPHAWMNDSMWKILVDGAGLADVWPALLVLTAAGVALLGAASAMMARSLR